MITFIILGLFSVLLLIRVPVTMSMLFASLIVLVAQGEVPLVVVPQFIVAGLTKFELLAVPFFILAAEIMNSGGLTERIFRFAIACVGGMRGGLAQVNVVASVIFAGISGTAVADAAGLGRVEVDSMRRAGYDTAFAAAVTLSSSVIGPLVPPSVVMIIYAIVAEVSVGKMLLAGVVPGLLLALVLMIFIYWLARTGRVKCPDTVLPTGPEFRRSLLEGLPALFAPFIILMGIIGGVVTPTEAGVAACAYSFLVSTLIYREMSLDRMRTIIINATQSTAQVMFIIGVATVMSWIITREQSAMEIAQWMTSLTDQVWVQLLMLNVFLLIIGALIEGVPALLVLVPVLLPVATSLGVDPVHFGVIMVLNIVIGLITPPMGIGLFIMSNITGQTVERITMACLPFLVPLLLTLLLVTFVPWLSLWLPNLLMGLP
ncbi:MAG: TRAP transporter large permease [Rhodospirillales bacterium]|nr:TRAP transporter large permease [Rhodospirillales bacterium]